MDHRDRIITWLAKRDGEAIARKVQRDLQHMTEGMQSGDDSGLANLWDEVCVQMQRQASVMWELYTDIMTTMILTHVRSLTVEQQEAIWLQTSASEEGDSSQDGNATDSDDEIASYIMREYLLNLAVNWKNRRIERFLYEGRDLD